VRNGFTLIEMSLTVLLIGVMLAGLFKINGTDTDKMRLELTLQRIGGKEGIGQLEQALILFAVRNGRLPCPADGALQTTDPDYGLENGDANGTLPSNGAACSTALSNSVIPWRTLGLDESLSLDGWGNRISYFPANAAIPGVNTLVDTDECLVQNTQPAPAQRPTFCDVANTGLYPSTPYGNYIAVYEIANGACGNEVTQPNAVEASCPFGFTNAPECNVPDGSTDNCQAVSGYTSPPPTVTQNTSTAGNLQFAGKRAAYVLISHGKSAWYAWTRSGTQIVPYNGTYTLKNYNSGILSNLAGSGGSLGFVQGANIGTWPINSTLYFDDIVNWRTPSFIIQHCGTQACGNY